jgi:hypothetical protein
MYLFFILLFMYFYIYIYIYVYIYTCTYIYARCNSAEVHVLLLVRLPEIERVKEALIAHNIDNIYSVLLAF